MADIHISKIKIRRGTTAEINSTRFDQGELVHATDSKRLFVGNGVSNGGNPVSSKIHPHLTNYYSLSTTLAEVGDLVSVNSIWYQLTASPYTSITNWGDMRSKISPEFIFTDSTLYMATSGLSASKINPNTLTNGVKIVDGKIQLDYKTNFFEISSNQLSIKTGSVTTREILSSSFSDGLSGGNGRPISLTVSPDDFIFNSGVLTAKYDRISSYGSSTQAHLPLSTFNALSALNAKVGDTVSVNKTIYQLQAIPALSLSNWRAISVDDGLTIYDTLTGNSTNNPLSALFNGSPSQITDGVIPGLQLTSFQALSSNGLSSISITLSSAGFITFESGVSETGKNVNRFAIPIFTY